MSVEIQLIQYNTHLFGGTVPGNLPWDPANLYFEDEDRRDDIVNKLMRRGPNIVCLEEVWADSYKDIMIGALSRRYPGHFYPEKSDDFKIGSGLLLLTSFDIVDVAFHGFTDLTGSDSFSQKGFIVATLGAEGTAQFHLIMAHTQADYDPEAVAARRSNLLQILKVAKTLNPSLPIVLCGDLNVIGESPRGAPTAEYTGMLQLFDPLGLADSYRELRPDPRDWHGFTYNGYRNKLVDRFAPDDKTAQQRLDYVLTDAQVIRTEVVKTFTYGSPILGGCDLSDHYPLRSVLTLPSSESQ